MTTTTTDVRVWGISTYDGVRGKTYKVRWKVDERQFCKTHKSKPVLVENPDTDSDLGVHAAA